MVAVGETDIEVGDVGSVSVSFVGMDGTEIVDVAVAEPDLEGVGLGVLSFASIEVIDTEHLARHDTVKPADGVEEGAEDFADHSSCSSFGVVEKDVGDAVGDFTDGCSAYACGEEVVEGGRVGLAEEFPRGRTDDGIEEGDAVGESVFAGGVVEHGAVVGMAELVAREAVVVPHPIARDVVVDVFACHSRPRAVGDEVVPTEHEGVDAEVFDKGLQGGRLGCAVGILAEEVKGAAVGGEGGDALLVGAEPCEGVVPDGVGIHGGMG